LTVFVVIASATVVGPVVFSLASPRLAAGPLQGTLRFMSEHNAAITVIVLALLGTKLIGQGSRTSDGHGTR
jgi:hypothetical protein